MPRPHRRRREKKLMTMDEVNERFPRTKYKTWRSARESEGLPAAGGITTAPPSRAASIKEIETLHSDNRGSVDSARPGTAAARPSTETPSSPIAASSEPDPPTDSVKPSSPDKPTATTTTTTTTVSDPFPTPSPTSVPATKTPTTTPAPEKPTPTPTPTPIPTDHDHDSDLSDDSDPHTAPITDLVPGDSCAICLDSLDEDDDVRGLTCGHAFHAACLDPWLTSRRACCPLCKADYYVPKPRADGTLPGSDATGAAGNAGATPAVRVTGLAAIRWGLPTDTWLSRSGRPVAQPGHGGGGDTPTGRRNRALGRPSRHSRNNNGGAPATAEVEGTENGNGNGNGNGNPSRRWRARFPTVRVPANVLRNPLARRRGPEGAPAEGEVTPGRLEAGQRGVPRAEGAS
ncbi:hypothetical protein P152DRAFT_290677 [Eremomyces bilateralis CBS 781.70]|uniref:RING-type domain-containing protein n=1 Tax=Eremomyces bilateralis CBS 781.70 TaxID=1392243 RepID=A0A6G1G6S8_9PEZI|nr:uncharacterized protein P152DRAFT_290677 [Eremomyces bilateralis CBS 781.70]KAF1813748.1 hypothetical protein P152DRAFT_290677 [Eremomyces bilateralis CBS 781.70]